MRKVISGCLIGALAMTMLASESLAAETLEPLVLSDFDWKPGQICTYDFNHNGRKAQWICEVTEVSGPRMKSVCTKVGAGSKVAVPVTHVKTASGIRWTNDLSVVHGTAMEAATAIQWGAFPLAPGKKWKGESVISGANAANEAWKVRVKSSFKAGRWANVKTPAGDFMTMEIVVKESISGLSASFSGTGQVNYWIGRGGCPSKKLEYKNSFGETGSAILVSEKAP